MGKRHGLFKILGACVITGALLGPAPARASDVDRLLDLLVKKHVLTEEDAATFREEVKKDHEFKADPPAAETSAVVTARSGAPGRVLAAAETPSATPAKKSEIPVTGSSPIRLSGWMQTRFTSGASVPYSYSTLEMRRARLVADGNLSPQIAYKVQFDLGKSPALLDARLDYSLRPYAKFTVGQFKIPFSQESLDSARDLAPIERSRVALSLAPGRDTGNNGRDIGLQLSGSLEFESGRPIFDYAVGVFNGSGINHLDDNRRRDGAGRVVFHPA